MYMAVDIASWCSSDTEESLGYKEGRWRVSTSIVNVCSRVINSPTNYLTDRFWAWHHARQSMPDMVIYPKWFGSEPGSNQIKRLQFVRGHKDWAVEQRKKAMWSDESSRFTLLQSDGHVRVRRRACEGMHPSCIVPTLPYTPLEAVIQSGVASGTCSRMTMPRFIRLIVSKRGPGSTGNHFNLIESLWDAPEMFVFFKWSVLTVLSLPQRKLSGQKWTQHCNQILQCEMKGGYPQLGGQDTYGGELSNKLLRR